MDPGGLRAIDGTAALRRIACDPDCGCRGRHDRAEPLPGRETPTIAYTEHRELTADDVARLAEAMPPEYRALVYVGAVLGLRWSEAVALRIGRFDLLRHTVTVAEGLHEVKG